MARLMFLDAHTRALYTDWPAKARAVVATLRMVSGRHPDDPLPAALVGESLVKSPEFAAMWADHRVKSGGGAEIYEMRHPHGGSDRRDGIGHHHARRDTARCGAVPDRGALRPGEGTNGVKVRDGAVWVSNLDKGTLTRIPLRQGRPGPIKVKAGGLTGIDDFAFAGDQVIATLHGISSVVRVGPDGKATTLLTASDGLQTPTSVAVRGRTLHVLSAAYTTATDPTLLLATLPRH
jgi:hypothetical protein